MTQARFPDLAPETIQRLLEARHITRALTVTTDRRPIAERLRFVTEQNDVLTQEVRRLRVVEINKQAWIDMLAQENARLREELMLMAPVEIGD